MKKTNFNTLLLKPALLENLHSLGYHSMTPIQAQSLPPILEGEDIIGKAKTGSGKTAAFGLGLLQKLNPQKFRVQALVLCPTRELADQVAREIRKLARGVGNVKVLTLNGGAPFGPQKGSLEHGAHIIVGTPGRVEDHLYKGNLNLSQLNCFVLDEADRMLDSGFEDTLNDIIEYLPEQRQTLLFSATYPDSIQDMSQRIMKTPRTIEVLETHNESTIAQTFYKISSAKQDSEQRITALRLLLLEHQPESTLVFCNTKKDTQMVADTLNSSGFKAMALHGDLDQKDRDRTLVLFANKSTSVLVATDVAARGLDVEKLDAVFNYQLARELDVHTHRIGRTGRAGSKGIACTLFSDKEQYRVNKLEEHQNQATTLVPLPSSKLLDQAAFRPPMVTLQIDGGKKQKLRPGDILGALTGEKGISGSEVGKIVITDFTAFVAISRHAANDALKKLEQGNLKGKKFQVRRIS